MTTNVFTYNINLKLVIFYKELIYNIIYLHRFYINSLGHISILSSGFVMY